jgi:hypothetical protein
MDSLSTDDLDELDAICPPTPNAERGSGYSDAERELLHELGALHLDFSGAVGAREALQQLIQHPAPKNTLTTLATLLANILKEPSVAKYRSVRLKNKKIQYLVDVPASLVLLKEIGFIEEAGVLSITKDCVNQQTFSAVLQALEEGTTGKNSLVVSGHLNHVTGRKDVDAATQLFIEDSATAALLMRQLFEHEIATKREASQDTALHQLYSTALGILSRIKNNPKESKYHKLNLNAKILRADGRCRPLLEAVGFVVEEGDGHLVLQLVESPSESCGSIFSFERGADVAGGGRRGAAGSEGVSLATLTACIAVLQTVRGVEGSGMRCGGIEALFENSQKDAGGAAALLAHHLLGACAESSGCEHVLQLPAKVLKAAIETGHIPHTTARMWLMYLGLEGNQRGAEEGGRDQGAESSSTIGESDHLVLFVQLMVSLSYMKAYRSKGVPMQSKQSKVAWAVGTIQGGREYQEDRWRALSSIDCTGGSAAVGDGWSRTDLFGVFDGHGGAEVSTKVARELPSCIARQLAVENSWTAAVLAGFQRMEHKIKCRFSTANAPGSTAVVVLVRQREARRDLLIANLGDSRAVLCTRAAAGGGAIALTDDHNCDVPEEKARIVKAGGVVTSAPFGPSRVNGQLAMARSFGA